MAIPPTDIRILFTNYDIITYVLNLASCSEHFISIKHLKLATFNKKKINSDSMYAFNAPVTLRQRPRRMQYVLEVLINVAETCLNLKINLAFQFILRPS